MEQFKRFLVQSPLQDFQGELGPDIGYGSFHQQYWLAGKLIAVGVVDILPSCVSSVYFFYNPDYNHLSLGTYASLREIALVRHLHETCPSISWYYLGFYIHSCPKMNYKAQYKPSYLLCPESYSWQPIQTCLAQIEKSKYSRLDDSGLLRDEDGDIQLSQVGVLFKQKAVTYQKYKAYKRNADDEETVLLYATLVGMKTAKHMLLYRSP
nr:EOG090X06AF [Polyphemus pediculus]